jgi:hypothetical protein
VTGNEIRSLEERYPLYVEHRRNWQASFMYAFNELGWVTVLSFMAGALPIETVIIIVRILLGAGTPMRLEISLIA